MLKISMYQFYKERLDNVCDIRTLENFLKKKGDDTFLKMKKQDLFVYLPDEGELSLYPETVTLGDNTFQCEYNFEPGKDDDGVTVRISSVLAPSVPSESLDWVVPGLFKEKITLLIKGLPKAYRRMLVPVATSVDIIVNEMEKQTRNPDSAMITTLSNFIRKRFRVDIPASAWPLDTLPDHLKMRISLTGPEGKELCSGRDKSILTSEFKIPESAFQGEFEAARKQWEKTGLVAWDFGDLPEVTDICGKNGNKWCAYPGLEPDEKSVSLRLFLNKNEAVVSHRKGVVKLFTIAFSKDLKFLKKNLALFGESGKHAEYFGGARVFEKRMYESILNDLFCKNIRTQKEFYSLAESVWPVIIEAGRTKLNSAACVLKACHEFRSALYTLEQANKANKNAMDFFAELRKELAMLVPETFIELYDAGRTVHLERYIKAMTIRAQRFLVNFEKDQIRAKEVRVYTDSLNNLLKGLSSSVSD